LYKTLKSARLNLLLLTQTKMQIHFNSVRDLTSALMTYRVPMKKWRFSIKSLYNEYEAKDQQFFLDLRNGLTSKVTVVNVQLQYNGFALYEELVEYDISLETYERQVRPNNLGISEKMKTYELQTSPQLLTAAKRALREELQIFSPNGWFQIHKEVENIPLSLNEMYSNGSKGLMTALEIRKVTYHPSTNEVKPYYYEHSVKDGRARRTTFGWRQMQK
jgi:hypothetical protein